jgi:hypothetical protein
MTHRQRIAGPGGAHRAVPSDIQVTTYEPGTRLAFRVTVCRLGEGRGAG